MDPAAVVPAQLEPCVPAARRASTANAADLTAASVVAEGNRASRAVRRSTRRVVGPGTARGGFATLELARVSSSARRAGQ
jgi:hypothetical protein